MGSLHTSTIIGGISCHSIDKYSAGSSALQQAQQVKTEGQHKANVIIKYNNRILQNIEGAI